MPLRAPTAVAAALLAAATLAACSTDDDRATPATPTTSSSASTTSTTITTPTTVTPTAPTSVEQVDGAPPARLDPALAAGLDVDDFARRLASSRATMVDPAADPADRAQAGIEHQLLLRELAGRPELDDAVVSVVDASARPELERVVRARQFLQQRTAARPAQPPPDELPAWTIVEPEPVDTLLASYDEAEQITGVPWYWLAAIHLQETRMGRIRGVSSAGAVGPMQFLPTTWQTCCTGDPTDRRDAIVGAATYLAQSGAPDDMAAALFQYNPNDGYVAVVTAYAENLRDEPELYHGYHAYQVFVGTSAGTVRLPVGYSEPAPIDAASYLAAHPTDAA